jgi:hypothetical protein
MMLRVSLSALQYIMEEVGKTGDPFYVWNGNDASLEARLLLPLKTLAYGVPPHCFTDYFSMSPSMAMECCNNFDNTHLEICAAEFLKTVSDG